MSTEDRKGGIPFYPMAKLGDWGLARQTHAIDPDNPTLLHGAGTRGYQAPVSISFTRIHTPTAEHHQEQKGPPLTTSEPDPILAHTNVWAIGATMCELMTLHKVNRFLLKPRVNIIDEEGIKPIQTSRKVGYSSQLSKLIQACLKPNPRQRPSVTELRTKIATYRGAVVKLVRECEGTGRAEPLENEKLYYVGNEIKGAKTGEWQPLGREKDLDQSDEDGFADPDLSPIQFPVFKKPGE